MSGLESKMDLLRLVLNELNAGRWSAAHQRVQDEDSPLAAWLHGLLHVQEGDLEDAEYWYGLAGRHFRSRGSLAQELQAFEAALQRREATSQEPPSLV